MFSSYLFLLLYSAHKAGVESVIRGLRSVGFANLSSARTSTSAQFQPLVLVFSSRFFCRRSASSPDSNFFYTSHRALIFSSCYFHIVLKFMFNNCLPPRLVFVNPRLKRVSRLSPRTITSSARVFYGYQEAFRLSSMELRFANLSICFAIINHFCGRRKSRFVDIYSNLTSTLLRS